jgi:hypothetical protein
VRDSGRVPEEPSAAILWKSMENPPLILGNAVIFRYLESLPGTKESKRSTRQFLLQAAKRFKGRDVLAMTREDLWAGRVPDRIAEQEINALLALARWFRRENQLP